MGVQLEIVCEWLRVELMCVFSWRVRVCEFDCLT